MRKLYIIRHWLQDMHELMYEFRAQFDENVLGQCGTCRRKNGSGHKTDCHREYLKYVNREY